MVKIILKRQFEKDPTDYYVVGSIKFTDYGTLIGIYSTGENCFEVPLENIHTIDYSKDNK